MSITLKLLYRKYNRQSLSKQTLIVLTAFTIINLFIFFLLYTFYDIQNSSSFLETNSCPTCFGFKACEKFERNDVKLTFASTIKALFFSRNFIYKGFNQDGENIVISRIENSTQIQKWEEKICLKAKRKRNCRPLEAAYALFPMSGSRWMVEGVKGHSLSLTCPTQRMLESMTFRYTEKLDAIDISTKERITMVLTTWFNPRSVIYQMFPNQDGWFFPKYEGSCGRMTVYKMPGSPLYTYLHSPWAVRARLALSVLKLAYKFTSNSQKYALYMMQCGMADLYVSDHASELTYHEAEKILLVDRWKIKEGKKDGWNSSLIKEHRDCIVGEGDVEMRCIDDGRFSGDLGELCKYEYSDHNYHAVCRNIFTPKLHNQPSSEIGLLHNTPSNINSLHGLSNLLQKCAKPTDQESRSQIVVRLIEILTEIVNDFNLKQDL